MAACVQMVSVFHSNMAACVQMHHPRQMHLTRHQAQLWYAIRLIIAWLLWQQRTKPFLKIHSLPRAFLLI